MEIVGVSHFPKKGKKALKIGVDTLKGSDKMEIGRRK